ncbi:hypothetical protein DFH07DRAFT_853157 [Mycena maculata]|uniref:Uncharacterized protein n=1 Tax=Mycena maculata TaxID=230809 RepID=A0AAD7MNX4_9AGAR|nr:hypothetical protein DFH07DRAFT_853157 [Mycena maculata]
MSSSAIHHVIAFLTRPLLASFAPTSVASAQLILNATLLPTPTATFSLTSTATPPPAIHAASIGAGIPWTAWFSALGGRRDLLLFYGPGYLKVRVGDSQVIDVWTGEHQGSIIPISQMKSAPLLQQSTGARLRAMLLSARVRNMRRAEQEAKAEGPMRIPTLLGDSESDDLSSDSKSDSGSDYSSASSKFTTYSTDSLTSSGSPPTTPAKSGCVALPPAAPAIGTYSAFKTRHRVPVDRSKKDLTSYLYQGGVTRVMTGGVMLGPRPAAHVVRFTRS